MHIKKPAFEQFHHEVMKSGRPLREKDIVPIRAAIEKSLDGIADLLVEKVRRQPHPESLIEVSARWLGLAADPEHVARMIRQGWNDDVLAAKAARFHVLVHDDAVVLAFAAKYDEDRFLTGRMKVIF